ncbi:MAG: methyltransferase domain-containing protein [Rhodocyclaceae bacterium]|nr:methyltransferase domain-containing protein [Rhodocyclaceae bacterium]
MSIPGLNEWLETPLGRYVLDWEQRRCDQVLGDVFGFNALQLGLAEVDLLRANRMPLRMRCDDVQSRIGVQSMALPHHLPFAGASLDLVVLPHVLEFAAYPHQVLREVERVLVPEGQVLIAGFNPWSLWGLRRRLARPGFPWNGQYLSVARLKDWLTLLGFEIQGGRFGCYAPPLEKERSLQRCRWMDLAGDRWWPIFGGVYMLQAVKRVHGMRLIQPKWRERLAQAKALAPVVPRTNRVSNEHE